MGRIKELFQSVLSQDINKQARQVEIATLIVLFVLALLVLWLWYFQINITVPAEAGRQVVAQMNIFELLFSKH